MVKFGHHILKHSAKNSGVIQEDLYINYKQLKKSIGRKDEKEFFALFESEVEKVRKSILWITDDYERVMSCALGSDFVVQLNCLRQRTFEDHELDAIKSFAEINRTACRKILKKFDKKMGTNVQDSRLRMVDVMLAEPIADLEVLVRFQN